MTLPALFGVFFYRSANPRTLAALQSFLPVPVEGLTREFAEGATAEDVCARTIRTLLDVGARHFYISNLPIRGRRPFWRPSSSARESSPGQSRQRPLKTEHESDRYTEV